METKEIERKILSCIMTDEEFPERVGDLNSDWFTDSTNRGIYKAIESLLDNNVTVGLVTIQHQLKMASMDAIIKPSDLVEIVSLMATTTHLEAYIAILKDSYHRRELQCLSNELLELANNPAKQPIQANALVDARLSRLEEKAAKKGLKPLDKIIIEQFAELEERCSNDNKIIGLSCGMPKLDALISGFQRQNAYCIAARPAMGKTAFALNIAVGMARQGYKIAIYSLEMSERENFNRLIASESKVSAERVQNGTLIDEEWTKLGKGVSNLVQYKITINTDHVNWEEICRELRRLKRRQGLDAVILDQFSLVQGRSNEEDRQRIGRVSRASKLIAKELDIAFISLSQLNRSVEKNDKCVPMLSNLAESGNIEQDMNVIIFLYRPNYYDLKKEDGSSYEQSELHLIIAKNRSGRLSKVKCYMKMETQEIEEVTYRENY